MEKTTGLSKALTYEVEETCGYPEKNGMGSDFYFKHLILSRKNDSSFRNVSKEWLKELSTKQKVDFISEERFGTVSFLHVTSPNHLDSIRECGLWENQDGYVCDLGTGVYVIDADDDVAIDNLIEYLACREIEEEILIIRGTYTGVYNYCLHGEGHEGYIVLKETVLAEQIEDWYSRTIEDIFFETL